MEETAEYIYKNYDTFDKLNCGKIKRVLDSNNKLLKQIKDTFDEKDEKWCKSMYLAMLVELYKISSLLT
jgi:hypothetical protein